MILNHIKARIHDFSHIHNKLLELERWFRNHVDFETYLGLDFDEDENDRHRRSTEKKKQDRFNIRLDKSYLCSYAPALQRKCVCCRELPVSYNSRSILLTIF